MKKNFEFEEYNFEEFMDKMPSFDEVKELLENLEIARFYRLEDIEYAEKELDIIIDTCDDDLYNSIEEEMCKVAHLVLNNAMFMISKGSEYEFVYELTEEDKKNYRFSAFDLKGVAKVVYGGYTGTIDLVYEDGREVADMEIDVQEMKMLADYMYDVVAKRLA